MKNYADKFLGAVFGSAVSDAVSAPYESILTTGALRKLTINTHEYQRIEDKGMGIYTVQTEMLLTVIQAILKKKDINEGALISEIIKNWETKNLSQDYFSTGQVIAKIISGEKPQKALASVGKSDFTPLIRGIPGGLWCNGEKLKKFTKMTAGLSEITHKDYRVTAGTVAVSAAAAYLIDCEPPLKVKDFLNYIATAANEVDELMAKYIYSIIKLSGSDIEMAEMKLKKTGNDDFSPYAYGGGVSPFVISVLLISIFHFIQNPTNFHQMMNNLIKSGGHINATCTLAGGLWGAFNGYNKLPRELVTHLNNKENIYTLAVDFYKAKYETNG